jgi:uncharacterized GH25 family protein
MKRIYQTLLAALAVVVLASATHDFFILPETFFLHKGDKLNLHLLEGDQFMKQDEIGYPAAKLSSFVLYEGKKKTDLSAFAKDTTSLLTNYIVENSGQHIISAVTGVGHSNFSRDSYADFLTQLGYDKLADKVKNGNQFRVKEKYVHYLKTLFSVDDNDGNAYEKKAGNDFEIILKDNPYKKRFGEDLVASVSFMDKPVSGASVVLYIKSLSGNVYTQNYTTDAKGELTITMSREGIYMLRAVRVAPTTDTDADYASWWTTYTFPFSSSEELLNTYKEFGFGNIH